MAGIKAPFFDLKATKTGQPYLLISQSRGEGKEAQRVSVMVFANHIEALLNAVKEFATRLQQHLGDQTDRLAAAGEKIGQKPKKAG